jgi:hypothetical protein
MEYTDIARARIDTHRMLLWIDIPDETHTGREMLSQLALHLRCGIPCAQYFYNKIRGRVPPACGACPASANQGKCPHCCTGLREFGSGPGSLCLPGGADRPGVAVLPAPWGGAPRGGARSSPIPSCRGAALCARRHALQDGAGTAAAALARAPPWGCAAMAPASKVLGVLDVGARPRPRAHRLGQQVGQVVAPDCAPLVLMDGLRESLSALRMRYCWSGVTPKF